MNILKLLTIVIVAMFMPSPAQAYKAGDVVLISGVCKNLQAMISIKDVAVAGTGTPAAEIKQQLVYMTRIFIQQGICASINRVVSVKIEEVITTFEDYEGDTTQLIRVRNRGNNFYAFVVAEKAKDKVKA